MPEDQSPDAGDIQPSNDGAEGSLDVFGPSEGENEMAQDATAALAEPGNMAIAMTALANGFGASADRRSSAADQLAADSQRMWSIAMTSPTVMAAQGIRMASESGAGRTRIEANTPASTQTVGV